jgi:hypothetical protein
MLSGNFILLDAARMNEAMDEAKKLNPSHKSLYAAEGNDLLYSVAPYLFRFENQGEFNNYFIEKGWGDSWGILISTKASFDELYNHFKRFLMVKTEDGLQLFFRFYDPRVLRIFLPTCDTNQLREFFGPIESFLLEDEDLRFGIKFWLQNGILQSKKIHFREISSSTDGDTTTDSIPDENYEERNNSMIIPKQSSPDKTTPFSSTNTGTIKPSKPKWNLLD